MSAQKTIITTKLRKKSVCEPPRRHSTANQRSSLAHIFFGATSPFGNRDDKNTSHLTIPATSRKASRDHSQNRRTHFADVPIDSRRSHEFNSDGDSDDSGPMFFAYERPAETGRRNSKLGSSYFLFPISSPSSPVVASPSNAHTSPHSPSTMRKVMRVVVVGSKKVGKTAILRQLTYYQDVGAIPYTPTIDDTYQIQTTVDADERPKELIIFHDTAGVMDFGPLELKRPYIQVADAFLLVYSVLDHESFNRMDQLKKFIDRQFGKEKKEVPIIAVGTMIDLPGRQVDRELAVHWATREKVKLFEVSARDRASLLDVVHYLSGRYFHPLKEPKFSITKRLKPEKTNAQIVMDF